jgi:invasion protein IalB
MIPDATTRARSSARVLGIAMAGIVLTLVTRSPADTISPLLAPPAEEQELVYSPWVKSCLTQEEANVHLGCLIGTNGHTSSGMPVVAAVLIERPDASKKILRVKLPLGLQLSQGTQIMVDQGQPMNAPYIACVTHGCISEYEASNELIDKLKQGQSLIVQGIDGEGHRVSIVLPLVGFGKAFDGPPTNDK